MEPVNDKDAVTSPAAEGAGGEAVREGWRDYLPRNGETEAQAITRVHQSPDYFGSLEDAKMAVWDAIGFNEYGGPTPNEKASARALSATLRPSPASVADEATGAVPDAVAGNIARRLMWLLDRFRLELPSNELATVIREAASALAAFQSEQEALRRRIGELEVEFDQAVFFIELHKSEIEQLRASLSEAEQNAARIREEAAEDERDRLLAVCYKHQDNPDDDARYSAAVEAGCLLEEEGAMLPADRQASRSSKPDGGGE